MIVKLVIRSGKINTPGRHRSPVPRKPGVKGLSGRPGRIARRPRMHDGTPSATPRPAGGADLLALGFGTTVAMWAVGYVCRFPGLGTPGWLLLLLLLTCLFGGGLLAGLRSGRGWRGGALVGLLAGLLNLLVLGSLLGGEQPNRLAPSAAGWLPGSLLLSGLLGAAGALVGAGAVPRRREPGAGIASPPDSPAWTPAFAWVAVAATFLLLLAGGIVTSQEAGLAVVDWPNSYGYNMFLYPLARMTGGIYYEHAHRLLGSLVGLTTLVLAIHLLRTDRRPWLKRTAVAAVALVVLQGILGGLRVTGRFTLSDSPADTSPSLTLAVLHGVTGQIFFGLMVALALFTSRRWRSRRESLPLPCAGSDRGLARLLAAALLVQLVLGAILRHVAGGLLVHITVAMVVVAVAVVLGVRTAGLYGAAPPLPRLGRILLGLIGLQLLLGLGALVAVNAERSGVAPHAADVVLTTAHQATGALLLACAVAILAWLHRLTVPAPRSAARGVALAED
jgi:cytochrome c oxidase assembly protein subunit 15